MASILYVVGVVMYYFWKMFPEVCYLKGLWFTSTLFYVILKMETNQLNALVYQCALSDTPTFQGPILLTQFNFDPGMDKKLPP